MPEPEKNAMALVNACRTPLRRKIMILAEEEAAQGGFITSSMVADRLGAGAKDPKSLPALSYHVKQLVSAGALKEVGGEQKRGAWQRHLAPSEAFQATMTDTVALDQIAELVEDGISFAQSQAKLFEIIRATGRPVEA